MRTETRTIRLLVRSSCPCSTILRDYDMVSSRFYDSMILGFCAWILRFWRGGGDR